MNDTNTANITPKDGKYYYLMDKVISTYASLLEHERLNPVFFKEMLNKTIVGIANDDKKKNRTGWIVKRAVALSEMSYALTNREVE